MAHQHSSIHAQKRFQKRKKSAWKIEGQTKFRVLRQVGLEGRAGVGQATKGDATQVDPALHGPRVAPCGGHPSLFDVDLIPLHESFEVPSIFSKHMVGHKGFPIPSLEAGLGAIPWQL